MRQRDFHQKLARHQIMTVASAYNDEFRIRSKMQRWKFSGPEAIVAARVSRNFKTIGNKCRPCVVATFFRTLWNGWPTTWRMRSAPGAGVVRSCLLGCSGAVDKIEHYLLCPVAWHVLGAHRCIELRPTRKCLQAMLLAEKGLEDRELLAIACAVYSIARTVQTVRANNCEAEPLLKLYLAEALRACV